jgi:heterodisulfide reductase subunit A-like polyferredoxin
MGFGTYPDVVTTVQVEQMLSSGKGVYCPSDGRAPERVAILLYQSSQLLTLMAGFHELAGVILLTT